MSKGNIYVKNTAEETAVSNDILKLPNGLLDMDKPFKLFDMKKFQQNVNRELKRQYPDRRKLESQCISLVSFGTSSSDILDCPIWVRALNLRYWDILCNLPTKSNNNQKVLMVNVVAMEMLRTKIPPSKCPSFLMLSGKQHVFSQVPIFQNIVAKGKR